MKHFLLSLILTVAATASPAQTPLLPALFDVSGVASDDVLNVREGPAADRPIIATLSPTQTGLEIVDFNDDASWGLVGLGETAGWVSMRFMTAQPGQYSDTLARPLSCFGTEPFWDLYLNPHLNIFDRLDGFGHKLTDLWQGSPTNRQPNTFGVHLASPEADIHAVITRARCDDGMSDRQYGLHIVAILSGTIGPDILTGCCSLGQ